MEPTQLILGFWFVDAWERQPERAAPWFVDMWPEGEDE